MAGETSPGCRDRRRKRSRRRSSSHHVWDTYGRFPATIDPFLMTVWFQAQHLDIGFYDRYYPPEALPRARAQPHAGLAR